MSIKELDVKVALGQTWDVKNYPRSRVTAITPTPGGGCLVSMRPLHSSGSNSQDWAIFAAALRREATLVAPTEKTTGPIEMIETRRHAHYFRSVAHLQEIDIYRFLDLFGVTDQALGHAIKKLVVPGMRGGGKTGRKDIEEAIDTLQRRLEMMDEDDHRQNAAAPTPPARIDGKGGPSLDHSELRKTWAPGQRWQYRFEEQPEWRNCMDGDSPVDPNWFPYTEYRRHPDDVPAVLSPSPTRAPLHWGHTGDASDVTAYRQPPAAPTPPVPWYPDDSGAWVEVPDTTSTCPCDPDAIVEVLVREERETKRFCSAPRVAKISHWDHDPQSRCRIVAYRKVPRV